ncbi:hypothetical protein RSSM_03511 [Rhodopirellula sallentina SM41]|uniref:Uncharacterized protein n=1 Tax=Rhodopirellula sallentina SM41 TaxID=1263870 RepID=M5UGA6_9BACT|nr:hypothetical protein RSSM_03511 [Rhodopirellula sallentina SM41]
MTTKTISTTPSVIGARSVIGRTSGLGGLRGTLAELRSVLDAVGGNVGPDLGMEARLMECQIVKRWTMFWRFRMRPHGASKLRFRLSKLGKRFGRARESPKILRFSRRP